MLILQNLTELIGVASIRINLCETGANLESKSTEF